MPNDADAELEILITTAADKYGVDQVNAALMKYRDVLGETGKETEHHNSNAREMRHIFRELNQILPQSGQLLKGLLGGPEVALFLAGVAALKQMAEALKEHREQLKKTLELQGEMFGAVWAKQREELRGAREDYEKFNNELAASVRTYDQLKAAQEEQIAVFKVYNEALAKSDEKDKQHTIQLQRAAEAENELVLERKAAQIERAREAAQDRLDEAHAARLAGAGGAKGAEAAAAEVKLKADQEAKTKADQEMAKILSEGRKRPAEELIRTMSGAEMAAIGVASPEDFARRSAAAAKALEDAKNAIVADQAVVDAHKRAMEPLVTAEKEAEEELKRRTEQLREANQAAATAKAVLGAKIESADEQALLQAGLPPGALRAPIGRSVIRGIEAAEAGARGEHSTGGDQIISAIIRGLRAAGNTNEQINALLKEMMDGHVEQEKKIRDLFIALKAIRTQVQSSGAVH